MPDGWMGLDIGRRSASGYPEVIGDAGTVFGGASLELIEGEALPGVEALR